MNTGERICQLRKSLGYSMEKFANSIGVTKSSINKLEKGINNASEQTLKLICSEFNVSYDWLVNGIGEMYMSVPESFLDQIIEEYKIGEDNKPLLKAYIEASEEQRKQILEFIKSVIKNIEEKE